MRFSPRSARVGMGEVYRARDTRLGREVAIKVLHVAASDAEMESRLRREAQSIVTQSPAHLRTVRRGEQGRNDYGRNAALFVVRVFARAALASAASFFRSSSSRRGASIASKRSACLIA